MAKMSVKKRMINFESECLENGKKTLTKDGYRAIEIDRNVFNKIFENYSDIAEIETDVRDKRFTGVFSRKSTANTRFMVLFTSAKRGRPSKRHDETEIRRMWNNILKDAENANK